MESSPRPTVPWLLTTGIAAALLVPAAAAAHGIAAAITRVVGADPDGPTFLALTEGHAARAGSGWRYVCPALYGQDRPGVGLSPEGAELWVAGGDDLYRVDTTGAAVAQNQPELDGSTVTAAALVGRGLYLHRFLVEGSRVVRIEDGRPTEIWSSEHLWQSMTAHDGGLALARVDGSTLTVLRLDADGREVETSSHTLDADNPSVRLRSTGSTLYLVAIVGSTRTLHRLDDGGIVTRFESDAAIEGPVEVEGVRLIATANELLRLDDAGATPIAADHPVTCLDSHRGVAHACSLQELYELGPEGLGARVATLQDLLPPSDPSTECSAQWMLFENDLGRVAGARDGGPGAADDDGPGCDCRVGRRRSPPPLAVLVAGIALLAALRRRK